MNTLDPAVRDLLVAVHLALRPPWSGDDSLAVRVSSVRTAVEWTVRFGHPGWEVQDLERAIELADAARARRSNQLDLFDLLADEEQPA